MIYKTEIHLKNTDATGVLFFGELFTIALEAFEAFLQKAGRSLKKFLEEEDFLFPVVHAEADYLAPLTVGDPIEVAVRIEKVGVSSFTVHYDFTDTQRKIKVSSATLIHVVVSKKNRGSIPIPPFLMKLLENRSH